MNMIKKRRTALFMAMLMTAVLLLDMQPVMATSVETSSETETEQTVEEPVAPAALDSAVNQLGITSDSAQRQFTITVTDVNLPVSKVYMPVWSSRDGQDDVRWYSATKLSDTAWQCTIDIKDHHSDSGKYEVHVYAEGIDGQMSSQPLASGDFFVTDISAGSLDCVSADKDSGIYRLQLTGVSSPAGIDHVQVPVWSEVNGQDDIYWYDAVYEGGQWYIDVDISRHHYDAGKYMAHAYVYDKRGMQKIAGYVRFDVSPMKTNRLYAVTNSNETQVTITMRNAALSADVEYVTFPVWGKVSGQNDIQWYRADKLDDYTYQVVLPISNHKETGEYEVHAYAVSGANTTLLSNCTFHVQGITGSVAVVNKDDARGTFDVEITNVSSPAEIKEVLVPIWSQKDGQDDLYWYKAAYNGGKWVVSVDIGDHKIDTGTYNIHVYASDGRGIQGLITGTTVNVVSPSVKPSVQAQVMPDYATVKLKVTDVIGASRVRIPVWGDADGNKDIYWYDAVQTDSRTWEAVVQLGNHMEIGGYQAHVYGTINNKQQLLTNTTFSIEKIIVDSVTATNQNNETGTFRVNVQNISGLSKVDEVLVGVWSAIDGQDDLTWYPAKFENGKWVVDIDPQNHYLERGIYYAHAYAYDPSGNSVFVGGISVDVVINGKLGFVMENGSTYYYPTLGNMAHGFERIKGSRYFFDRATGAMYRGWNYIDGFKYYFDDSGKMIQNVDSIIGVQSSYILKINKQMNCVTMYAYDPGTGSYCIPVKAMLCSTGDDTPIGTFSLSRTYRWLLMYNGTYCQFCTQILRDYLMHSITYETTNNRTLITQGYNRLGVNKSAGCVRLVCGDAYWIYNLVNSGRLRQVTIYNSADAGPFEKPYVAPIPEDQRWDPTDPTL